MDKNKKKILIAIVGLILIVVMYYLFSPYQNCIREQELSAYGCAMVTNW